ncbi:serine/threonine-protein kinase [Plantactinospora veratri]
MYQERIADRYLLLRTIGTGGMGWVWLAHDEMLRRPVAVKQVVPPDWMTPDERDEVRCRTLREARIAARLNHPNVVRIYDVVQDGDSPWIVMEYVPSRSVQQVLEADGPLSPVRTAEVGLAVLAALCAAHASGVLHRDVKPHNVLIAEDGRVVLTDFGLATVDGGDGALTRDGVVIGSPQYVSPERAADGSSTVESDLWSLGATLYAAVEGRSPYHRSTTMATLTALAVAPPDPTRLAGPLRPVLAGLLRRDPRQRLTADEVERMLRRIAEPPPRSGRYPLALARGPAPGRRPRRTPAGPLRRKPRATVRLGDGRRTSVRSRTSVRGRTGAPSRTSAPPGRRSRTVRFDRTSRSSRTPQPVPPDPPTRTAGRSRPERLPRSGHGGGRSGCRTRSGVRGAARSRDRIPSGRNRRAATAAHGVSAGGSRGSGPPRWP